MKIVAILKKKKLKTHWGFIFNTDIQNFVENFMNNIHAGSGDYWLCYENEKPEGVYTDVKVIAKYHINGEVASIKYEINT